MIEVLEITELRICYWFARWLFYSLFGAIFFSGDFFLLRTKWFAHNWCFAIIPTARGNRYSAFFFNKLSFCDSRRGANWLVIEVLEITGIAIGWWFERWLIYSHFQPLISPNKFHCDFRRVSTKQVPLWFPPLIFLNKFACNFPAFSGKPVLFAISATTFPKTSSLATPAVVFPKQISLLFSPIFPQNKCLCDFRRWFS